MDRGHAAKVISHNRTVTFQIAGVAISQQMFQEVLRRIVDRGRSRCTRQHVTPTVMRSIVLTGGLRSDAEEKQTDRTQPIGARGAGVRSLRLNDTAFDHLVGAIERDRPCRPSSES